MHVRSNFYKFPLFSKPFEVYSKRVSDGTDVKITLRLVGEIQKHDSMYTNVKISILHYCNWLTYTTALGHEYYNSPLSWHAETCSSEKRLFRQPGRSRNSGMTSRFSTFLAST